MTTSFPIRSSMNLILLAAIISTAAGTMHAQQAPSESLSNTPTGIVTNTDALSQSSVASNLDNASQGSLTASQIEAILQQRPELVVELKSFAADQLQQQGSSIQADSISDEMLYNQIASNPSLRRSITLWLRARGYITTDNVTKTLGAEDDEDTQFSSRTADRLQQSAGLDLSQYGSMYGVTSDTPRAAGTTTLRPGSQVGATRQESTARSKERSREPNVTDDPEVLRLPTPYNLPSLRDLYTQVPEDDAKLKRFGSNVFVNRDTTPKAIAGFEQREVPIDLPVGPDYILGSGDGLTINLSGGVSQNIHSVVDREGKIVLPEAGPLVVAGLTLQRAQIAIEDALRGQFHDVRVDVTIARLRTVRVYVVGDVQRPGAYDLSSLATPLNALYAAGGPTSTGSLRIVRHLRGSQLIREVDLYDFLLHGIRMDDERLESGDTLLIPPVGPQVAISGMVKRPAIYEMKGDSTLADVLEDAGGATVTAALNQIRINRVESNQHRDTISLNLPASSSPRDARKAMASFSVKDGDHIRVASILPYSETPVYLQGHVVRPGKIAFHEGMRLSDVIHSYQDLLPEPATNGEIVRLVPPDLHPDAMQFEVVDVLVGNNNIALQPFDTIRIFGRYEVDSPEVTVQGEVLRPGKYALSQGMTVAQLVRIAGGFKRDALLESADLTSYSVHEGKKIAGERKTVRIGAAVKDGIAAADVALKPGDIVTIHQISGWNDIGASVSLEGEVTYPGSYGLQEGERLSSVLRRAGGLRNTAYPAGAILVRAQVKELEEKSRLQLIHQIETSSASARLAPNLSGQDQSAALQLAAQQQSEALERLRSQPASGRLVIHISADINSWANTPADIEMRSGDVLTVPKRPGFVLVSGQVYNASAITFVPGKDAEWYLRRAGGANEVANRKEIVIVRANGTVVGRRSGQWYDNDVLKTRMDPGDVLVVPQKIIGGSLFWRNLLTVAQISSSIAITAAVAGVI